MKKFIKVFAVLIFFVFSSSCSISKLKKEKDPIISVNENIFNSFLGDFNGDGISEHIYVYKSEDGKPCVKLITEGGNYYKELNDLADNFYSHVTDVNGDGKEEFILYISESSHEKMYIFSFTDDLNIILSPEIMQKEFDLAKVKNGYVFTFGSFEKKLDSDLNDNLTMEFNHTDIFYEDPLPLFIVDGIIKSSDKKYYTVTVSFTINSDNDFEIKEVDMLPYEE